MSIEQLAGSATAGEPVVFRPGAYENAAEVLRCYLATASSGSAFGTTGSGDQSLDRPLFVDAAELARLATELAEVLGLVAGLEGRLFDGDVEAFRRALQVADVPAGLPEPAAAGLPPGCGRAMLHHDGTGFRLLEFTTGGLDDVDEAGERCRSLLADPGFARFADEHALTFTDCPSEFAQASVEAADGPKLDGNTACLAFLHEPGFRHLFTADERATIDRIVPWTRSLHPSLIGRSAADFRRLIEFCHAQREDLVLKPSAGAGEAGVLAGWESTDKEWVNALDAAVRSSAGHVVQRRVRPRPEPFVRGPGAVAEGHASWDLFLTPAGYGGCGARIRPAGDGSTVGAETPTTTAAVFVCG